jgi:Flp pilus assembly protein CpaB
MELIQRRPAGTDWRKWYSSRRGTLTIAAISTLIAAGILLFAMHRYRQSVSTTGKPATVLVATQLIEQGTSGDAIGVERLFKSTRILTKQVRTGAFADPAALHGEVAATDIYPGQQLTAADFVSGGGFVSRLAATQRAVAVPVDTSHGMIGEIHTGDHVDVYASFQTSGSGKPVLRLLAPNVVVLKAAQVGGGGLGSNNSTTATGNVVLEVNTKQAAELAFTTDNGKVWLTLRPGQGSPPSHEIVSETSILLGSPPASLEGSK